LLGENTVDNNSFDKVMNNMDHKKVHTVNSMDHKVNKGCKMECKRKVHKD
jgi:hypothetical protein